MHHPSQSSILLPLLLLAGCGEDQPSTAPSGSSAGSARSQAATAALRVVNSLADPGDGTCNARQCTLREAIRDPLTSQITFSSGLSGTITLARPGAGGGQLVIDKALTIVGPSAGILIQRRSSDPAFRILRIETGANVALTNLTLRNGRTDHGAGIINFGTLILTHCTVTGNASQSHGGGIDNHGFLTLTSTTVSKNSVSGSGQPGGGIDNHNEPVTITRSSIIENSGTGILNRGGRLEITRSGISNNSRGGIYQNLGRAILNQVRIAGNSGGGMSNDGGVAILRNSTVAFNSGFEGGGIRNSFNGDFTIEKSAIINNSASDRGGGIRSTSGDPFGRVSASVIVINSTISGNTASIGGGIENSEDRGLASVDVINSTIAGNSASKEGGGVDNTIPLNEDAQSSIVLRNTIVARNTAPSAPDAHEAFATFSLIGDGTGSGIANGSGNLVGTHNSPIDPRIGPLADNGGPTRTRALLAGSPAIDAASATVCPATDQRGVARPQGAGCDMGSFEK